MRILATKPNPELVTLPWDTPLEEWPEKFVVQLPRGLSRHVVRFVRVGEHICAVKETDELDRPPRVPPAPGPPEDGAAHRRPPGGGHRPQGQAGGVAAQRAGHPAPALLAAVPVAVLPRDARGQPAASSSTPSSCCWSGCTCPGFFWGDVSLSNVLFRRSAGEFAAYLVDAETGELHERITDGQRGSRPHRRDRERLRRAARPPGRRVRRRADRPGRRDRAAERALRRAVGRR